MVKIIGILIGIMMIVLAGMALLIIEECIRDHIRYRKSRNESQKGSGHTKTRENADDHHQVNVNNAYLARQNHTTAARMGREAHDTAVRDSQWLHDDACRMAHESHDTAVYDHRAAVDCHDQFASAPDFAGCNPSFNMKSFIAEIRKRYRILKYSNLLMRIRECIICNEWDFQQAADYLMLTRKERQHCLGIIQIKAESIEGAVEHYFSNRSSQ